MYGNRKQGLVTQLYNSSSMCMAGALFNHFQQSPDSSRSDICKILCRPKWTWVRRGLQGMVELCPRLFPAFGRYVLCFPNGFYIFQIDFVSCRSLGLGCDPLWNMWNISFTKTTTVVHCDKLLFRLHGVIIAKTSQQTIYYFAKSDMYKLTFRLHGKRVLKRGVWLRRNTCS